MKKILFVLIIFMCLLAFAQIVPVHNFDVGAKLAKVEGKDFIVMFSSTSCPYCTKFIEKTYPDPLVQKIIMNNYIFIELTEKSTVAHLNGKSYTYGQLLQGFGIRGTPSFVFFTTNATPITILPGYVPADTFSSVMRYIKKRLYEKKINFNDYMKERDNYLGNKTIIKISKKDVGFILKNDIYAKVLSNIKDANDIFAHYIVDNPEIAKELNKKGFYNILLISD